MPKISPLSKSKLISDSFSQIFSFFADGYPNRIILIIVSVELLGLFLAFWRLKLLTKKHL